jgi:dethiobiotin synthetase
MRKIFVTGIGTDVGKTVVSAVLVEALKADYWKPVQTGLDKDTQTVKRLISNSTTQFHKEGYWFKEPASPHHSAELEGDRIDLKKIKVPETSNALIIEGAGGLMVPLNNEDMMIDLVMNTKAEVVLVVRHYLGSINHTLCSIEILKQKGIKLLGIIFSGDENEASEKLILEYSKVKNLGRVDEILELGKFSIAKQARKFSAI